MGASSQAALLIHRLRVKPIAWFCLEYHGFLKIQGRGMVRSPSVCARMEINVCQRRDAYDVESCDHLCIAFAPRMCFLTLAFHFDCHSMEAEGPESAKVQHSGD